MQLTDFDYDLPGHLIARHPLLERDASRLLDIQSDPFLDRHIADLPQLVQPGDLWVLNDTRVIPARLLGKKQSGGKVELLLLEPTGERDEWIAWGKANKPLKAGETIVIADNFRAEILQRNGKEVRIRLMAENVMQAIEANGHIPLPPYINRVDTEMDKERYQAVFANKPGAVAAPTAGLHLTEALMKEMQRAGATFVHVTLHVGPGTFQPVQVDSVHEHVMHEERYEVSEASAGAMNQAKAAV